MTSWRGRAGRLARAAAVAPIALGLSAVAAQDAPESILPEGVFGPDEPARAPAPAAPAESVPEGETSPPPVPSPPPPPIGAARGPAVKAPPPPAAVDLAAPRVTLGATGVLDPGAGGFGADAWAGSDPRVLARLMARLDTPIASRWAHITLRRALASRVPTPAGVPAADWIAARARLLLRMGEVDVAKAMVDRVPVEAFTPNLYAVAADTHLAAGDAPALCPLALTGGAISRAPVWRLAQAMCAAFEGDDISAANGFDALREDEAVAPFDIALAERLASAGGGGARAANLEWNEVDRLNLYRVGLAAASGAELPQHLFEAAPASARAWLFRAAAAPPATRALAAPAAATLGVAGSAELVAFHAALGEDPVGGAPAEEMAARLRAAYAATGSDRMAALRALWGADDRYAAYVLTAGAALRLAPERRLADDAADVMAAALAGGRADVARQWAGIAAGAGGDVARRAWPLAAMAGVPADERAFESWAESEGDTIAGRRRVRLALAALVGLGRAERWSVPDAYVAQPLANRWTARLQAAAAAGRRGEVALLAAVGLQGAWEAIPPQHLAAILAAYRQVGLTEEARLIAAEALTRA